MTLSQAEREKNAEIRKIEDAKIKVKTEAYFIQRIADALNRIDALLAEAQELGFDTQRLQREAEKQ